MVAIIFAILAVGFFLAGVVLMISIIKKFKADARFPIERKASLVIAFFLLSTTGCLIAGIKIGNGDFEKKFAREIMLEQVSVKGESSFVVATKVTFQDAELSNIMPIKGSAEPIK